MKKLAKVTLVFLLFISAKSYAQKESDFRVALSFDPKMKVLGPYDYSTSGEWNLLLRAIYKRNHFEYGIFIEAFDAISYSALGVNVNYVFEFPDKKNRFSRWELVPGLGYGVVLRDELEVYEDIVEANGDVRYYFNNHLGVQLMGNLKYRSDLVTEYDEEDPWRLSAFFGLIYRW